MKYIYLFIFFLLYSNTPITGMTEEIWVKNEFNIGKRPACPFVGIRADGANYMWQTLDKCKTSCINEPMGICNMLSRFGEDYKSPTDLYHCRFYACPDPYNFTWITQSQWGNGASTSNTYMLPIRHYIENVCTNTINKTETIYNYKNITRYINETTCIEMQNQTQIQNQTQTQSPTQNPTQNTTQSPTQNPTQNTTQSPTQNPTQSPNENSERNINHTNCEEQPMSKIYMVGFFITLGLNICCTSVIIWRCWLKKMLEDYIDDLFCCGYGDKIKNVCTFCGIFCECCENKNKARKQRLELATIPKNNLHKVPVNIIISRDPATNNYKRKQYEI